MNQILVTGATGNVGQEVVRSLCKVKSNLQIKVAVRDEDKARKLFTDCQKLSFTKFDFEDPSSFSSAFAGVQILFLLRPPHISDVEGCFRPLLEAAAKENITKIIFLSVQGAEKSKVIPHNKIERLIQEMPFDYIFIRPSYFMQNLTTALLPEIQSKKSIILPAGKAEFNWIDIQDIGEVVAKVTVSFEMNKNQAFEITGPQNLNFYEVTSQISEVIGEQIVYTNMSPIRFYFKKRKEGLNGGFAIVMTMLHFLPRLQKPPRISSDFKSLTKKQPTSLRNFLERNREKFK